MTEERNKKSGVLSRRDFLKDASLVVGGAAIGSTVLLAACGGETETETKTTTVTSTQTVTATPGPSTAELTVLEPTGESSTEITSLYADRLDTLNGAVIALMACAPQKWQPHRILPHIAELISERYSDVTFIPQTEFQQGTGIDSETEAEKAVQFGVTAMIDAFAA